MPFRPDTKQELSRRLVDHLRRKCGSGRRRIGKPEVGTDEWGMVSVVRDWASRGLETIGPLQSVARSVVAGDADRSGMGHALVRDGADPAREGSRPGRESTNSLLRPSRRRRGESTERGKLFFRQKTSRRRA